MLFFFKTIVKSRFVRNALIIATGTAGAQAITLGFSPIVTRLYSPEDFGLLGSFMAVISVMAPMATLSYHISIVLPKEDLDSIRIAQLNILIALGITAIISLILFALGDNLTHFISNKAIIDYYWLIPFSMLFSAFQQIFEQCLIRHKKYKVIAHVTVTQSLIINSGKVLIGFWYPIPVVLIFFQILGSGFNALLFYFGFKKSCDSLSFQRNDIKTLKKLALKYRNFPIFRAPEQAINAASQGLPILMLATLFSPTSAGFYTLARSVIGIPASLLGKSIGDVFYPRISDSLNKGEPLYPIVKRSTFIISAIGLIPYGLIFLLGPWLFSVIFGKDWLASGEYARWLAIWLLFGFANIPSVNVIPIINAHSFQLIYTICITILRFAAIWLAYYIWNSDIAAIISFSVVGCFANLFLIVVVLNKCKKFDALLS